MEEDVCAQFFSVLRQLSHRKAALTLPLRAGSQQLSVKYGDLGSGRTGLTKFVWSYQKSRQNLYLPNF